MRSIRLSTEVKQQWARLVQGMSDCFSALLQSLIVLLLVLVDQNPYWAIGLVKGIYFIIHHATYLP